IGMGYFFHNRDVLVSAADELFGLIASGMLKTNIDRTFPLRDAAQAHRDIEERRTTGSVILIP
ncbi:MAG: zinc-binding dehydrogenase, partial [Xanthobacteraceae bacterium]